LTDVTSVLDRPLPRATERVDLMFGAEPLRAMYDEHAAALLAFAVRFTTRTAAEDAVQETFLRAWRNLPRLEADPRPLRPWLVLVLRRVLIDARRAELARPVGLAEDGLLDRAVDGGYDRPLDRCWLDRAMQGLSPAHRHVLVEIFYRDGPVARVAARLDVPAGTVRSRLHYALRALRDQLVDATEAPPPPTGGRDPGRRRHPARSSPVSTRGGQRRLRVGCPEPG
jgi:RNA polymerase sigma-70 factor (ECF subfamily)